MSDLLAVHARCVGAVATIHVVGELDTSTAPELAEVIQRAVADGVQRVVLDLVELTFLGSAGINLLVGTWSDLAGRDPRPVVLLGARPNVERVLRVCGVLDLFEA